MSERAVSPLFDGEFGRLVPAYRNATRPMPERRAAGERAAETRRLNEAYQIAELERVYAVPSPTVEQRRARPRVTRRARRRS